MKQLGRRRWKQASGYHRQGRVENAFFRYKSIIGDGLRARSPGSIVPRHPSGPNATSSGVSEDRVTQVLGAMSVAWITTSDHEWIEKNLIGLLSLEVPVPLCQPVP